MSRDRSIRERAAHDTASRLKTARIFSKLSPNRLDFVRLVLKSSDPLLGSGPQREIAGACSGHLLV
jgi:hypothetical protein